MSRIPCLVVVVLWIGLATMSARGHTIDPLTCSDDEVVKWTSNMWQCGPDESAHTLCASGEVLLGDGSCVLPDLGLLSDGRTAIVFPKTIQPPIQSWAQQAQSKFGDLVQIVGAPDPAPAPGDPPNILAHKAISLALDSLKDGGTVLLWGGTYTVVKSIKVNRDNYTIRSAGGRAILVGEPQKNAQGQFVHLQIFEIGQQASVRHHILIEGIDFHMPKHVPGKPAAEVVTAVRAHRVHHLSVRKSKFLGGGMGVDVWGGENIRVSDNYLDGVFYMGIQLRGDIDGAWIERNRALNTINNDGIKLAGTTDENIGAVKHHNIFILNNISGGSGRDGIDVAVNDGENIIVNHNIVYDNTNHAIEYKLIGGKLANKLTHGSVSHNILYPNILDDNMAGVSFDGDVTAGNCLDRVAHIRVAGNIIHAGHMSRGIRVGTASNVEIQDNTVNGGKQALFLLGTDQIDVIGNRVVGSQTFLTLRNDTLRGTSNTTVTGNVAHDVHEFLHVIDPDPFTPSIAPNLGPTHVYANIVNANENKLEGPGWRFNQGPVVQAPTMLNPASRIESHETGGIFSNGHVPAGAATLYELPPAKVGLRFTFVKERADKFEIKPQPTDAIAHKGASVSLKNDSNDVMTIVTLLGVGDQLWAIESVYGIHWK